MNCTILAVIFLQQKTCVNADEFFISDVGNTRAYQLAQSQGGIYYDTADTGFYHNIFLDTLNKRVFLLFQHNLTILSYSREPATGVINKPKNSAPVKGLTILYGPKASSVTIVRPGNSRTADFYFYDLSGRVIDKMLGVTSNAVLWKPKTRSMNCYIVMVRSGKEKYTAKFMVR